MTTILNEFKKDEKNKNIKAILNNKIREFDKDTLANMLMNPNSLHELKEELKKHEITNYEYNKIMDNMSMWLETYDTTMCFGCFNDDSNWNYTYCCRKAVCQNCSLGLCPNCYMPLDENDSIAVNYEATIDIR